MLTIREQQLKSLGQAVPGTPMIAPCEPTWIEVRLVDTENRPVAGERYRVQMPDHSIRQGSLNEEGRVRFDGIPAGQCHVCFPEIHGSEWSPI
jgi:hypothetical protein